jgi:hydrogenase nickel incorporation protein HypB
MTMVSPTSPAQDHEAKGESGQDFSHRSTGMASVAAAASTHTTTLEINLLAKNNLLAAQNRGWFEGRNVLALNLMSFPRRRQDDPANAHDQRPEGSAHLRGD